MGCVTSKKDINDLHPNIFQVCNIDNQGNRISSGQLEIKETELVFYQRGKQPVRWPLKTLRRYGHHDQVFSFESGRRCPTGPGIYAFSCRRAEKLFNYVQSHIQIRSDDTLVREVNTSRSGDYLEPRTRLSVNNGPNRLGSVGSSNASPSPPPNNDYPPPYSNYYANDPIHRLEEPTTTVTSPVSPTASGESEEEALSPVYMNVGSAVQPPPGPVTLVTPVIPEEDERHCYMNLVPRPGISSCGRCHSFTQNQVNLPLTPEPRSVNYIVLDLNGSSPPPPPSPTVRPMSEGYVTIDFDKTVALSHSVNPNCIDNEGSRKTRHNSATPRQSASLSD